VRERVPQIVDAAFDRLESAWDSIVRGPKKQIEGLRRAASDAVDAVLRGVSRGTTPASGAPLRTKDEDIFIGVRIDEKAVDDTIAALKARIPKTVRSTGASDADEQLLRNLTFSLRGKSDHGETIRLDPKTLGPMLDFFGQAMKVAQGDAVFVSGIRFLTQHGVSPLPNGKLIPVSAAEQFASRVKSAMDISSADAPTGSVTPELTQAYVLYLLWTTSSGAQ
jgi:hypothetical protein